MRPAGSQDNTRCDRTRLELSFLLAFIRFIDSFTCAAPNSFDSRLMEQLLEKEREYQAILQQVLAEREQEIRLLRLRSEPAGVDFNLTVCNTLAFTSSLLLHLCVHSQLLLIEATPLYVDLL